MADLKFKQGDRVKADSRSDHGTVLDVNAALVTIQWDDAKKATVWQTIFATKTLTALTAEEVAAEAAKPDPLTGLA